MQEFKRIADTVYGTISFTEPEIDIIDTRIFQRLRSIKHLGLASLVYPSADFSRFSHSLGVCHITARIMDTLLKKKSLQMDDDLVQHYRIAGLLHDIGHYPFSHIFEKALKTYYQNKSSQSVISDDLLEENDNTYLSHEDITREIISNSPELQSVFKKHNIEAKKVIDILTCDLNYPIINIISSDFDADRIDYLLRTANTTSLPYGAIDCDYLISQIKYDLEQKKIVLDKKALKTADHFLLSRYFAYQQLSYHKAVVGLELLFKDIIIDLINFDVIKCSSNAIKDKIKKEEWIDFDDSFISNKIHEFQISEENPIINTKIQSLKNRIPPALIFEEEFIAKKNRKKEIQYLKKILTDKKPLWADEFEINKDLWIIWDNEGKNLTEIESHVPVTLLDHESEEEIEKRKIKGLDIFDNENKKSIPIVSIPSSLMSILSNYNIFSIRLYIIFPHEMWGQMKERTNKISQKVKNEIATISESSE